MNATQLDIERLHHALSLAKIRKGFCAPNPSVGALIISQDGQTFAEGIHETCGSAHAELVALQNLKCDTRGATLYVTLEPCCHWGKTPPCTDAIIKSGIKRVVFGFKDPNPIVNGKGHTTLQNAGILCDHIPITELDVFYESYQYWHVTKKPFVTVKLAISLDGKIAGPNGERIQISGAVEQEFVHLSRKTSDAILTTAKTIIYDDPKFNVRLPQETIKKRIYILDTHLKLPTSATIFNTTQSIIVFHGANADSEKKEQLQHLGASCIPVDLEHNGLNLHQVLDVIGQDGVHDLWVEAGGQCFASFVNNKLVQKALIAVAPCWIGKGQNAFSDTFLFDTVQMDRVKWKELGRDGLCEIRW